MKLALAKIGAVAVPLNTMLTQREIAFLLEHSDAVAVVFNDRQGRLDLVEVISKLFPEIHRGSEREYPCRFFRFPKVRHLVCFSPSGKSYPGLIDFNNLFQRAVSVSEEALKKIQEANAYPDEVFEIMYTSGTTGFPKGSMLSHDMLLRNLYAYYVTRDIKSGARFYSPLPFYHIFAWGYLIMAITFFGGSLVTHSQFTPGEALKLIEKYEVNEVICVPSILLSLVNHPDLKSYNLSSLRSVFCAATPAPPPLWEKARNDLELQGITTAYGLTEAAGVVTVTFPGESFVEVVSTRVGRLYAPNCSGLPEFGGRNIQAKIVDPETMEELPPGKEGELLIRGNTVSRGYYKLSRNNAEVIDKDGWLRTGDLMIIHPDGLFQFMGRSKEIYKTSGENVAPKEIEDVLSTHPKVNQAFVAGIPHQIMGEVGAAFINLKTGQTATRREIISFCKENLARFKVPRHVFFVSAQELPYTATGKVQKFKLVEYALQLLKEGVEAEPD